MDSSLARWLCWPTPGRGVAALASRPARCGYIVSPMPGYVIAVVVATGEALTKGQALLTVEAMKMEHVLMAPIAASVEQVTAKVGDHISEGAMLILLPPVTQSRP